MDDATNDQIIDQGLAERGHHRRVARPHADDEGPIAAAEQIAAQMRSPVQPLGARGRSFRRNSPFVVGLTASAGVAVTYGGVVVLGSISSVLVLIGAALFFALGLEPAVSSLVNRKVPRWAAVSLVVVIAFGVLAAAVAAAIPPLVHEVRQFFGHAPQYLQAAQDHSSAIGRLNERFHVQHRITDAMHGWSTSQVEQVVKIHGYDDMLGHDLSLANAPAVRHGGLCSE